LLYYEAQNSKFPGPAYVDVTKALSVPEYHNCFSGLLDKEILQGRDFWGTPLHYEVVTEREAILRSFGRNGVDDGGQGDDQTLHVENLPGRGSVYWVHSVGHREWDYRHWALLCVPALLIVSVLYGIAIWRHEMPPWAWRVVAVLLAVYGMLELMLTGSA
jgi:hypothetical protein